MRPFWAINKPELVELARKRREIAQAWAAFKQVSPFSKRGMTRALFVLGWLAAEQYHAKRLQEHAERVAESARKAAERETKLFLSRTALSSVDVDLWEQIDV